MLDIRDKIAGGNLLEAIHDTNRLNAGHSGTFRAFVVQINEQFLFK